MATPAKSVPRQCSLAALRSGAFKARFYETADLFSDRTLPTYVVAQRDAPRGLGGYSPLPPRLEPPPATSTSHPGAPAPESISPLARFVSIVAYRELVLL